MEGIQTEKYFESTRPTTQPTTSPTNIFPAAEPTPDWNKAKELWGIAWHIHWIGLGVAFSVLAVISVVSLVQTNKHRRVGRKPLAVAINALLLVLGITRALYLFVDPYESRQNGVKMPRWAAQLLYNISFPCLSSAFYLIFLVFLEVAKIQVVSKKLQNARFLVVVVSVHFAIVLFAEVSGIIKPDFAVPFIVCQLFFTVWGLLLSASFIFGGLKVICRARNVKKQLTMLREKHQERSSVKGSQKKIGTNASKVAKITLVTSGLGLAWSIIQLYSLIDVYHFYRDTLRPPPPWLWWSFQTCFRLVEIAMACTIVYCVMQPSHRNGASSARRKSTARENILSEKGISETV